MEAILLAIKDLVKYKAIGYINTGDKTMDNMLNTLVLAIITTVFAVNFKATITAYIYRLRWWISRKNIKNINEKNILYWKKIICDQKDNMLKTTWYITSKKMTNAIVQYTYTKYSWQFKSNAMAMIDSDEYRIKKDTISWDTFSPSILKDEVYPIYVKDKEIIALTHQGASVYFLHTSDEIMNEFIEVLDKEYKFKPEPKPKPEEEEEEEEVYQKQVFIHEYGRADKKCKLFKDRTFDKLVSKHKNRIIRMLDMFKSANDDGLSRFNGLGTYNLGFMFYGPPGTGKTSMIKAICNYLERDALIIDMRNIRTVKDLEKLSTERDPEKYVYVFDEFDCMQDLLQRRTKTIKEECQDIQNEINELFKLKTVFELKFDEIKNNNSSSISDIDTKITHLKDNIRKLENQLSLDTMLTFLDGTIETRNRVIIASTNHIEKIDPALLREGRFDIKICLNYFTDMEIKQLLEIMYGVECHEQIYNYTYQSGVYTPVKILNIAQQEDSLEDVMRILAGQAGDNSKYLSNDELPSKTC